MNEASKLYFGSEVNVTMKQFVFLLWWNMTHRKRPPYKSRCEERRRAPSSARSSAILRSATSRCGHCNLKYIGARSAIWMFAMTVPIQNLHIELTQQCADVKCWKGWLLTSIIKKDRRNYRSFNRASGAFSTEITNWVDMEIVGDEKRCQHWYFKSRYSAFFPSLRDSLFAKFTILFSISKGVYCIW